MTSVQRPDKRLSVSRVHMVSLRELHVGTSCSAPAETSSRSEEEVVALIFFCSIFAPLSEAMEQIVETGCVSIAVC